MIYLITGVPGSGKTLYAVSTLLQKLMAEKLKAKDGTPIERRLVVDGIPDLSLPHELMCARPDEVSVNVAGHGPVLVPKDGIEHAEHGLWNWFQWCKPGDIIVCDEVQRHWRPRGMGVKPPMEIAALETHRHLGVDFILITQNPMLLDQNVRRLVGRHQHVRRILGMARAMIYEWDGCSADVHRTATATTSMWRFPKAAYSLYKSAELHTKQRFKIPLWLAVPALAVFGGVLIAPRLWATASGVASGRGVPSSLVATIPVVSASAPRVGASGAASGLVAGLPVVPASGAVASAPVVAGCVESRRGVWCFDSSGRVLDVEPEVSAKLLKPLGNVAPGDLSAFEDKRAVPSDARGVELASWVHRVPPSPPVAQWRGPHYIK